MCLLDLIANTDKVPYAGLLLADYGATVLRIDRPHADAHSAAPAPRTKDTLVRNKRSIAIDLKQPTSKALLEEIIDRADVLIEPFRPGVLEKLGFAPATLLKRNPRLIVARLTGFRRDGKYKDMAGHDINYLAVSGILSQLGRANDTPHPPANLLGDFAGGGLMCAFGIVMALLARTVSGKGQIVEENMVDAVSSLGTVLRLGKHLEFAGPRGTNLLDGGAPFYDTYETKDGKYMAVGALEPQFFEQLVKGLGLEDAKINGRVLADVRMDPDNWSRVREVLRNTFLKKSREEWEQVFDGTDACCTPILEQGELQAQGHEIRAAVTLTGTPSVDVVGHDSWQSAGLGVGEGGEEVLRDWLGWKRGVHFKPDGGALVKVDGAKL